MPPKGKAQAKPVPQMRISSFGQSQTNGQHAPGGTRQDKRIPPTTEKKGKQTKAKLPFAGKAEKPKFDIAVMKKLDAMLEGDMSDLPPLPRSVVRIFISSTFSDMRAERNALSCIVAPRLQKFCAKVNLDLQLVDLRWGLTTDALNDHSTEQLCLQEVKNCQAVSLGPNYISILGQRYGYRPLPTSVECGEFEMLRATAMKQSLDVDLLDTWYKRDDNAIPPDYVLQPIRSQYPHFGDTTPGKEALNKQDSDSWQKTFKSLLATVRQAATSLHREGKLSEERRHVYFKSVTEFETDKGIYTALEPKNHCLFYHRKLTDFTDDRLNDDNAQRYTSIIQEGGKKTQDKEVLALQSASVSRIENVLGPKNCRSFDVPWRSGGVDPSACPEHDSYIQDFCEQITQDVENMVQEAVEKRSGNIKTSEYYTYYDETLHHLRFCQSKCESFCGQEDILKSVRTHIVESQTRQPLIISAESGAGKTSVMAMIMNNLKKWIKGEFFGVIRFLGTSPQTMNIYDVIFHVCGQLADNLDIIMEPVGYKNMESIIDYFPRFLRTVSSSFKEPIIILLDSIDQLSSDNGAHIMNWLPTTLPPNVKLILSTLPREHNILTNVKKRLPDAVNYLEVPILGESTGREIINKYLKLKARRITDEQIKMVISTFSKAPSPLFLKLILDEAAKWPSFMPVSDLHLAASIRAAIDVLFDRLEKKFGKILVQSALGYITVGLNGISEIELEDALSCDDKVLDDLFQFHDPPIPGFVRIPPVLWARIRFDIKEYLVERVSQNKTTMFWYHRQFVEAARDRYVNNATHDQLHLVMLQVYLAEEGVKKSIFLSRRKKEIKDADRQVTPQPMSEKNLRKLQSIPHHLNSAAASVDDETAKGLVYCNLRFLCTKVAACSVGEVVKDMEMFLEKKRDREIQMLRDFLTSNKNNLKNPQVFAGSVLAYLNPDEDCQYIKRLQKDAEELMNTSDKTLLIPTFPCLSKGHSEVSSQNLLDYKLASCFGIICNENIITCGSDETVKVWSVKSGGIVKSMDIGFVASELYPIINNIVLLFNKESKKMVAVQTDTAELVWGPDSIPGNIVSFVLSEDKSKAYILTQDSSVKLHHLDLKSGSVAKSVTLQKMFNFVNIRTVLSASERYLVIQAECTPEDFKAIKDSWKKSGGFAAQPHPYRFAAVDLTHGTGSLQLCMRNLSKIPTLGVTVSQYKGNTMLIATKRHGIFWDIPTGKCDQAMSKGDKKLTMIYRPDWTGGDKCAGTNTCFVHPPSKEFLAVGSEDGYLFIYGFESGLPVGMKAPATKHSKKVRTAAVSPNGKVVSSVCEDGVVKLWNPANGLEMFALQVGVISHMSFTPDSSHLVALAGADSPRMVVFRVKLST